MRASGMPSGPVGNITTGVFTGEQLWVVLLNNLAGVALSFDLLDYCHSGGDC